MKKLMLVSVMLVALTGSGWAQMEAGDQEVQVSGLLSTSDGATLVNINATYGFYLDKNVQLGGGPTVTRFGVGGYSSTIIGVSFFGRYHFVTTEKVVPYIGGQVYQLDLSPDAPASFTDYTFLQATGGIKYFVNEYVAWDVSANLGFGLGGGTSFLLHGGLSAFF